MSFRVHVQGTQMLKKEGPLLEDSIAGQATRT
jgi:hypothetical protein